jgi:hypothetical protein
VRSATMERNFAIALPSRPLKATIYFGNVAPTSGDSLGTEGRSGPSSRGGDLRAAPILHYPRCHSHNILDHLSGRPQLMADFKARSNDRAVILLFDEGQG